MVGGGLQEDMVGGGALHEHPLLLTVVSGILYESHMLHPVTAALLLCVVLPL
jgi:hypothetical protein